MRTPEQWLTWAQYATGRYNAVVAPQPVDPLSVVSNEVPERVPEDKTIRSFVPISELLRAHNQLHREYGNDPQPKIVKAERMISAAMKTEGMPHRHRDALSDQARTTETKLPPLDAYEVAAYLEGSLHIETAAVSLVQADEAGRQLYLHVSKTLGPLARALQVKVNRSLPPAVNLPMFQPNKPGKADALVQVKGLYDLGLSMAYVPARLQRWGSVSREALAVEDYGISKSLELCALETYVAKAAGTSEVLSDIDDERYVKGVVLEPGVVDKTKVPLPDGEVTEGDTYDEATVRDACYYWMEASRSGARLHTKQGGTFLQAHEACLLENYLTDGPVTIGGRSVRAGTWVQAWRVYDEQLWQDIKAKKINAFSIGAWSKASIEPVE